VVFDRPAERKRLEDLVHPRISEMRNARMKAAAGRKDVLAFVWDAPLLFEVGLHRHCDAVVFVEAPEAVRKERVKERGWGADEIALREKSQLPLDKKRSLAQYIVQNTADAAFAREQVERVLSQILRSE
jgi:dephospho-CoA kinase